MNEILDISTEVPLEDYERAEFHDRLERAAIRRRRAQSTAVVFGIVTIMSTLVVAVGVVAVLLVGRPSARAGRGDRLPADCVRQRPRTTSDRTNWSASSPSCSGSATYLEFLMTDRVEAKEIRAYGIVPTLRGWHADLWDTRHRPLATAREQTIGLTTIGSFVTTAVLIATLSFALILAGRGSITIGDAAVAIVGLQQLSSRLQSAGSAFSGVHEGVTFLQDFETVPGHACRRSATADRRGIPPAPPRVLAVNDLVVPVPRSRG